MKLEFDKKQLNEIKERVRKQLEIIKSAKTILPQIAVLMYKSVMKNFAEEGTDKKKWLPLKPSTIEARRKGRGGGKTRILQDTGYLRASIFPEVRSNEAVVGTNVHYARIHQFGGKAGREHRVKIPARPFLWLRKEYQDRIMNLVANYLRQK